MAQDIEQQNDFETFDNEWNPLDGPVKQRSYTKPNISDATVITNFDEPSFEAPSFDDLEEEKEDFSGEPERPFNPSYSELDGKEKKMGAKAMADLVLDIYERGCGFLGKIPQISEGKIDKMIADGEIEHNAYLPTAMGPVPIRDFAAEYNETTKEAFEVSEDFKKTVKPPLIRVFEKRGIGMTDEQLLAYYFAVDLGTKGFQAFQLKKQTNAILDALRENTIATRDEAFRQQRQEKPPVSAEPQPAAPSQPDPSFVEVIEPEEVREPVRRAPRKPKTNLEEQKEYFGDDPVYANLNDEQAFQAEAAQTPGMPVFGDPAILSELDRLSQDQPVPKRKGNGKGVRGRKPGRKA